METNDELVVLRTFDAVHEAELAASALDTRGIDSEVRNGFFAGANPLLVAATGGVTLLVRASDVDAARQILDSEPSSLEGVDADGATCAGCGGPLANQLAACADCNDEPSHAVMTRKNTKFAIVKLKLGPIAFFFALALAPNVLVPLWERFTDLPESYVVTGVWSVVALIAGGLLVRTFATVSETRL